MSAQIVAAEDRSVHPGIRGVPWWAAILIAVAATLVGCAVDATTGNRELTSSFAAFYAVGCVVAVLAVRQSGIFTAVVQTPLILFVAVPAAYFLFHRAEIKGAKELIINCGYPLIERFPLMLGTSLVVLLIGVARRYLSSASPGTARSATTVAAAGGLFAGLAAKVKALTTRPTTDADATVAEPERPARRHSVKRPAAAPRPPRERQPSRQVTRSRHARPPMDDPEAPPAEPRRRRPAPGREYEDRAPRRRRAPRDADFREIAPEPGRESWAPERRQPRAYPTEGSPTWRPARYDRPDTPSDIEPRDPYEDRPTRDDTRLPYSNVRYRGDNPDDAGYRRPPR